VAQGVVAVPDLFSNAVACIVQGVADAAPQVVADFCQALDVVVGVMQRTAVGQGDGLDVACRGVGNGGGALGGAVALADVAGLAFSVVLVVGDEAVGILNAQGTACCVVLLSFSGVAQRIGGGVQIAFAPIGAVFGVVVVLGGVAVCVGGALPQADVWAGVGGVFAVAVAMRAVLPGGRVGGCDGEGLAAAVACVCGLQHQAAVGAVGALCRGFVEARQPVGLYLALLRCVCGFCFVGLPALWVEGELGGDVVKVRAAGGVAVAVVGFGFGGVGAGVAGYVQRGQTGGAVAGGELVVSCLSQVGGLIGHG